MARKYKALISDNLSQKAITSLEARGISTTFAPKLSQTQLLATIPEFDALLIRSSTQVTEKLLAATKKLKVVGRAGIGVDNVDQKACTKKGVVVMNSPFGNATTTAEHTLAMIFSLARHIPQANYSTIAGKWEKNKFIGTELTGKSLGLIGIGNIGSIVAKKALGLGLKVIAYDLYLSQEKAEQLGVKKLDWASFLKQADIISLHIPKTKDTTGIIGEAEIKKMKDGVMIINCARGGLIDEIALKKYLENGKIKGVALDVYSDEPAVKNPLFGLPNVICTPHLGASTTEAQEKVAIQIAEQVGDFLLDGAIKNALNSPSITEQEAKVLTPYLKLADNLSSFAIQLTQDEICAIKIEYTGEVACLNFQPLTQQIVKNILEPIFSSVNAVNANEIAKERGIEVSVTKNNFSKDYPSLIQITVSWLKNTRSVIGTLIRNQPRIVEIKGIQLEADFKPFMLYITNQDKPGFIGDLGTLLGKHRVNIASFHLGRTSPGQDAIALLELDEPLKKNLLDKIYKIPNVIQAKNLKF